MTTLSRPLVASMVPLWLELETAYANDKHGAKNPQRSALAGGLALGGAAFGDIIQYYSRFNVFHAQADNNEQVLVLASQQMGKYVNSTRALLSIVLQLEAGTHPDDMILSAPAIEEVTEEICLAVNKQKPLPQDHKAYWNNTIAPKIEDIHWCLQDSNTVVARRLTEQLLLEQVQQFVDFSCETGLIAQPGISSSNLDNTLTHWLV